MTETNLVVPERIEGAILVVRGQRVMLDRDLAALYDVKPIALRQQVKRNVERFPADFMFQLTEEEADRLVSQTVIPSRKHLGGHLPYAFTQEGIAMLSSVLRSERAVRVNIAIMRAFVRFRLLMSANEELARRVDELETRLGVHDQKLSAILDAIRRLIAPDASERRRIGFTADDNQPPPRRRRKR